MAGSEAELKAQCIKGGEILAHLSLFFYCRAIFFTFILEGGPWKIQKIRSWPGVRKG